MAKTHAAHDPYRTGDLRALCSGAPGLVFAATRESVTCKTCARTLVQPSWGERFVAVRPAAKPYKPEVARRLALLASK